MPLLLLPSARATPEASWHNLGAFRGCKHGHGIAYVARMEISGPAAVSATLDAGARTGMLCPGPKPGDLHHRDCYAAIDILAWDRRSGMTEHVSERCIPTVEAFTWWMQAIELRANSSDCPACEPAAYRAIYSG